MQEPFQSPPPIPSPLETTTASLGSEFQGPRVWKEAPQIVKSVALLTLLGIAVLPLLIAFMILGVTESNNATADKIQTTLITVFLVVLWAVNVWLRFALKKGTRAAWMVQIVISALGLTSIPIGTLIHGYILYHWFKPETKAWVGVQ